MKLHRWEDIKKRKLSPEKLEEIQREVEQEILELNLQAVRELVGKTQVDLAQATGMTQPEISRAEHRDDHLLSTLRRYIQALGGELEVLARFGDKSVRLKGI
jgi:predicted transcriptional regulator